MCRKIALIVLVLVVVIVARRHNMARADAERLDVDTIKQALKVPEIENDGFIERVVKMMDDGKLSRKNVTIAFIKARQRHKNRFQYFKHAMIELARREGVKLK